MTLKSGMISDLSTREIVPVSELTQYLHNESPQEKLLGLSMVTLKCQPKLQLRKISLCLWRLGPGPSSLSRLKL